MRKTRGTLMTLLHVKRLESKLTAADAAKMFNTGHALIWRYLESRFMVAIESLQQQIADYFKCDVAELFDSEGRAKIADAADSQRFI